MTARNDFSFAARRLVQSNLGWFHKTRSTLGESAGRERAININRDVLQNWFPSRSSTDRSPIEINTRYFHGNVSNTSELREIVADGRTIRNQGGGKNWRLAGDAIQGDIYDVRVDDLMLMVFEKRSSTLSWMIVRHGKNVDRTVAAAESKLYDQLSYDLGRPSGSMWLLDDIEALPLIFSTLRVFPRAGELLMADKAFLDEWCDAISSTGFATVRDIDKRLLISLKTKSFAILAGLSGSGKTLLARALAKWLCKSQDQYLLVPVGANWNSNDFVLGYPDALDANRYVKTGILEILLRAVTDQENPYFLILDEMNLSHVERYFSDFLSSIESPGERIVLHSDTNSRDGVPPFLEGLPKNLYVIGTINVDETTYQFSPKVLDRANVLEFRANAESIINFLSAKSAIDLSAIEGKGSSYVDGLLSGQKIEVNVSDLNPELREPLKAEIELLFSILAGSRREFGFRVASEMVAFIVHWISSIAPRTLDEKKQALQSGLDAQVIQKVLPRLHGSRKNIEPLLFGLGAFCGTKHDWQDTGITNTVALSEGIASHSGGLDMDALRTLDPFLPNSYEKIIRMIEQCRDSGFTSFAEG